MFSSRISTQFIPVSLLVAYLYLFFNVFLLPNGLFYTMLLSPFFLYNALRSQVWKPYLIFLLLFILFYLLQFRNVVSHKDYLRSDLLLFLNLTFLSNCYLYFRQAGNEEVNDLFKRLVYFNFIMVVIAGMAYFVPFLKPVFWYLIPVTEGSGIVARLKMLWSEASVYSLMLAPFFLYFLFYELRTKKRISFSFLLLLVLPLLLSNSMGVGLCLCFSVTLTVIFFRKSLLSARLLNYLLLVLLLLLLSLIAWYLLDKDNLLFLRLQNVLAGKDTSAKGRTFEAFTLAGKVLDQYHCWWVGIGPGQFKIIGKELLLEYYKYGGNVSDIRIPNACADTLIIYGIPGLAIRLLVQLVLFFITRVYRNIFRFSLFMFLFIYQFTGSYFNNLLEWTLWVITFSAAFTLFDRQKEHR